MCFTVLVIFYSSLYGGKYFIMYLLTNRNSNVMILLSNDSH